MLSRSESQASPHEETTQRLSGVSKIFYYTSKFVHNDDESRSPLNTPVRLQPSMRHDRRTSTIDITDRLVIYYLSNLIENLTIDFILS